LLAKKTTYLAEKIMPQLIQYRAKNALGLKKLCAGIIFFVIPQETQIPAK
jgi:hypothetical protein